MPLDSPEFRTTLKRLLVGLIVALVPLSVFGFYVALQGDAYVRQMNGEHFRSITHSSAEFTSEFVGGLVRDVGAIADNPILVQAVTSANQKYDRLSEDGIRNQQDALERRWNTPEAEVLVRSILTSEPAGVLRRDRQLNPRLLRISVEDVTGANVAATEKPSHYAQNERDYWRNLDASSQAAIRLTDLRYDDQTHLYYVAVIYPMLREGTGRFIGAVTALVDLSPLFRQVTSQQIGRTGHQFIARDDGTVVYGPGVTPSMRIRSDEFAAIRDSLGTLRGRETGYLYAALPHSGTYLIGFADTSLREAYPSLPWVIVASQEEREASGVVRTMTVFALLMMIFAWLILTLMAVYAFLHKPQRLEDIERPPDDRPRPIAA